MMWWKHHAFRCTSLIGLIAVGSLMAQTQMPAGTPTDPSAPRMAGEPAKSSRTLANSNTKLGDGDLIEVSVFGVPDLTTKARVSSSGDLYLPLIDYVHVGDLTTDEAQELIQKRLEDGGFVRGAHVSIFVDESASQSITVAGEVTRTGPYPAIGNRRLFDLISAAGGFTEKAGRMVTIEHRDHPEQKTELKLSANLADDTENNVDIQPGDTIIVSRAGIVYVVGDVQRPSGFIIEDTSLSVLKALALAGGSTRTSSLNKTRILRQTPNGIQEIPVPLKKVLYAKAPDVLMIKGDVLFIPGSAAKAAAYRSGEAAMGLATGVGILAIRP
jgi:polysaccharide export outer membrane protein